MSLTNKSPTLIFNNVELNQTQTSTGFHIQFADNIGVQFVWTGSPVGTFGINISNNAVMNQATGAVTGGDWTPLVLTTPQNPVAAGSAGNGYIDLNQMSCAFAQVTYTYTSGDGYCSAWFTTKGV